MAEYVRELPGDVLDYLMRLHDLENVSQFDMAHQQRASKATGEKRNKNKPIVSDEDWERITLNYDKWWNRSKITWNSDPRSWRALFKQDDLDALEFAGWCVEGDELYVRMLAAMRTQNALKMGLITYQELNAQKTQETKIDYDKIIDTISWALLDALKEFSIGRNLPFEVVAPLASRLSRSALSALGNSGIIPPPPDGRILPDVGQMKSLSATPHLMDSSGPDAHILKGIYAWARLFIDEELRPKPEQP